MKILEKNILAEDGQARIVRFKVHSPLIAEKGKPGQFVAVMVVPEGERIPLTIVEREKDTITIIVQEVGFSTRLLGKMKVGESLFSIVGPLGHATEIKNYGRVILIGGGVGIAEIYPVARALKDAGNHVITIIGSRTKSLLILENELKKASSEFYITTDDGSHGRKGFTTDVLKELLTKGPKPELVYAVGPIPMMRRVSDVTKEFGVKTLVSLNALMVDATGMCGGCRVTVGGKAQFTCVDGPEFDAEMVDWVELTKRNQVYTEQEKHICNLSLQ